MPEPESLFEAVEGGAWMPTRLARGPWSPDALHGGPTAALLARAAESAGDEGSSVDWQPGRLTVELLRPVPVVADFGNGISRVADATELTFINPDLTIHLHRAPVGEWCAWTR